MTDLNHEGIHEILKLASEHDNVFGLSATKPLCEKCQESFITGMTNGWWVLIDVVSMGEGEDFDLVRFFKLTPAGIAQRDKLNLH